MAASPTGMREASELKPRTHDVDEIVAHLAVAERQSLPTDDQIIMGHVRAALVLAKSLQRQLSYGN